jgi:hypothetical protein
MVIDERRMLLLAVRAMASSGQVKAAVGARAALLLMTN